MEFTGRKSICWQSKCQNYKYTPPARHAPQSEAPSLLAMKYIRPVWLTHSGEKKDFEVYSCHISPDGKRLVTAAGGVLGFPQ